MVKSSHEIPTHELRKHSSYRNLENADAVVADFEAKWAAFLSDRQLTYPRLQELQNRAVSTTEELLTLETSLKKQLKLLEESSKEIEDEFKAQINSAKLHGKRVEHSLEQKLSKLAEVEEIDDQNTPWLQYFGELELMAEKQSSSSVTTATGDSTSIVNKPSGAAFFLAQNRLLKAYDVDNAMLNMQIEILNFEIRKYQKKNQIHREVGAFLRAHLDEKA